MADPEQMSAVSTEVEVRACAGDIEAQRELVCGLLDRVEEVADLGREMLAEAHFWARVAYVNGTGLDRAALIHVLGLRISNAELRGDARLSEVLVAEALALLSLAADDGDEAAAERIQVVADRVPAEVVALGRTLANLWRPADTSVPAVH